MKKLGVYLLTAAMLLSIAFGGFAMENVFANPINITSEIGLSVGSGNATGMEIGDEVVVQVNMDTAISLTKVRGTFVYDRNIFETVSVGNIEPVGASFDIGWNPDNGLLSLSTGNNPAVTASGAIATITLKVKKATDSTVFEFTGVEIDGETTKYENGNVNVNVTNSKKDSREFTIGMASTTTAHDKSVFTVPVKINTNTGFSALGLTVKYGSGLSYQSVELSSEMKAYVDCREYSNTAAGELTISILALKDIKLVDKDLIYLNFAASPASINDTADIEVTVTQVENQSEVSMNGAGEVKTCTVSFKEALKLGDVNGDGKIDLVDASYVLQQYNGVRELNAEQKDRADTNASSTVTLVDALRIMKYYNGAIKSFY